MPELDAPDASMFGGPSETRGLFQSTDWSATPLGAMDQWSPVLKTMAEVCLSSGFPIVIHWGPELVAVYNDAFAAMIGGKHPASFGRPARQTWPEVWERVGGRLNTIVREGRTLRAEDERQIMHRNGYPEECYFSYSHSPIIDVDGTLAGSFTVSSETTAKVLYQRRTRVVRELGGLSVAESGGPQDTCRAALAVLAETAKVSIPFAIAYLVDDDAVPHSVADFGLAAAAEDGVDTGTLGLAAIVERVVRGGPAEVIEGLRAKFPTSFLPGPLGPLTPDQAVVLPLTVSGRADPIGALVLGVSPYRPFNEDYRTFFRLIDRQLRVALTDALAYQNERQRVQLLTDLDLAKMEFFQNVSHELRTPLTLLITPLQDLLAAAPDWAAGEQADLQAAVRAADRLRTMVDALLDFSGAEAGILAPDRQRIDLAGVTAEVASMFRSPAEHAGLHFKVQLPDKPVAAMVDRAMWSTIVTNLLSNAVKYTQHGGIDVQVQADEDAAVLTVTDTGAGIAQEEQSRVFERFHRAPQVTSGVGAGIGLALVADLVRAHGGTVDLTSEPDIGTTVTISIPRDLGAHAATRRLPEEPAADSTRSRLLLVEDDTDLRAYLTRLLTDDGWLVHAFPDAETAIAAALDPAGSATDLVLTDLVLPEHSGLHVVTELRAAQRTARLPMVILTGRGGPEAAAAGLAAGADDYITKPFSSLELLARVRANHELHRQREAAVGSAEDRVSQIRAGLESNRVIGTAVGVVMATYRLTAQQGFKLLVAASQHTNKKLRDIAADVAVTGTLPLRSTLIDTLLIRMQSDETTNADQDRAPAAQP